MALHMQTLPPSAHCDDPGTTCRLPLIAGTAEHHPAMEAAITNSFAFGGTNSSPVFRRAA